MSGLFGTLNIGKSGLFASQQAVSVTSHNISNSNTDGYTKQRAELVTTRPQNSAYQAGQLGTGVQVSAITRVRDNFLDYQTRVELTTKGQYDIEEKYLSQVENIMNEPKETGISTLLGKFYDSWQSLSKTAETTSSRTLVREQSKALTDELNHTYNELQSLKTDAQTSIKDAVSEINNYLDQISSLNQEIKQVKIAGQEPNDLMDSRDTKLDELSSKFGITIDKSDFHGINVTAKGSTENLIQTVNPDSEYRVSYVSDIQHVAGDSYNVTYYKNGDPNTTVTKSLTLNAAEYKSLSQERVLLTNSDDTSVQTFHPSSGELSGYAQVQQEIDQYTGELNKLAKSLAFSVNAIFSQSSAYTDDTAAIVNNFFVNSNSGATYDEDDEKAITAGNITVNQKIIDNSTLITAGVSATSGKGDGTKALAISDLRNANMKIQNVDSDTTKATYISGCCASFNPDSINYGGLKVIQSSISGMNMDDYFNNTIDNIGVDAQQAIRIAANQETLLQGFEKSRASVSGVSLDEEVVNLITYQRAYQANGKIISTVDELLDVVINGLKR